MADAGGASADGIPALLAEHERLLAEKARLRESGHTPPTKMNYDLTKIVNQVVELAKAQKSDELRSLLGERARSGHLGAESALEWLTEEDAWWGGGGG